MSELSAIDEVQQRERERERERERDFFWSLPLLVVVAAVEGICGRERVRDVEWFVLSDGVWDEREFRGERDI